MKNIMREALKQLDKRVYVMTFAMIILLLILLGVCPEMITGWINGLFSLAVEKFGWLYILTNCGCFVLFFYLYFGKYGNWSGRKTKIFDF